MNLRFLKSIRSRLTVWYSFAFLMTTILIFSAFYFTTRQALYDHTDTTLNIYGADIANIIKIQSIDLNSKIIDQNLEQTLRDMPGVVTVIFNNEGTIVGGSPIGSKNIEAISSLFDTVHAKTEPSFQNKKIGTLDMRFLTIPIINNQSLSGLIVVGHSVDVIEKSLDTLIWELVIVLIALAIPGIFGGYFLAKSAMKPVTDISLKLQNIGYKNLSERVPNPETGDELEELADTFNQLLDRINDAFTRERKFIGDIAHELKTPLAILKTRIEISAYRERSKEEYRKELIETLTDVDKLNFILKDILDLAWSESDRVKMEMKKIDLSELSLEIKEIAVNMAAAKNISIISRIREKTLIFGKKDKLSRALMNLIDNAIKYTNVGGEVEICLTKEKKNVVWQISDSGIGISSADLPHIFNRFYRGARSKKIQGSGLGLSIVKAIVRAHDGKIEVKSQPNKGTTFRIVLPSR